MSQVTNIPVFGAGKHFNGSGPESSPAEQQLPMHPMQQQHAGYETLAPLGDSLNATNLVRIFILTGHNGIESRLRILP